MGKKKSGYFLLDHFLDPRAYPLLTEDQEKDAITEVIYLDDLCNKSCGRKKSMSVEQDDLWKTL